MNDAKDSLAQTTVSFRAIRQMRAQKSPVPSSSFDNDSANRQATKLDQDHNLLAGPSLEIRREGQNLSDMEFDCHMSSLEIRRPDQNISDTGLDSRTSCSFSDAGYASEASTRRVRFSSNVTIKSNVLEVRPLNDEGPFLRIAARLVAVSGSSARAGAVSQLSVHHAIAHPGLEALRVHGR